MEANIEEIVSIYQSNPNYEPEIEEIITNTNYALNESTEIFNKIYSEASILDINRSKNYLHMVDFINGIIDKDSIMRFLTEKDIESANYFNLIDSLKQKHIIAINLIKFIFDK